MEINKENVVQAVVIMDTFNSNFSPINKTKPMVNITCNDSCLFVKIFKQINSIYCNFRDYLALRESRFWITYWRLWPWEV